MVEELLQWASCLGTTIHPAVQIYEDSTTGMSFRATEDIPPGTKLVSCSYGVTLSFLNAVDAPHFGRHSSPKFPQKFLDTLGYGKPNIVGHFFLVQQYLLRENSFWWPYIRLLPQPDEASHIPALWSAEDRIYLHGTNAEPAIKKRLGMWEDEWNTGIALLPGFVDAEHYTFGLYKWAASIFGSRSFRPSLTIPESITPHYADHIKKDMFSVLLPVLDIGNHNGVNSVEWTMNSSSGVFMLRSRSPLHQNEQIYNFYGNKSNSELLVGYGFTLPATPDLDWDIVNLKLKPGAEALALRRSQSCHVMSQEAEDEFMFTVHKRMDRSVDRVKDFAPFSHGLVELVVCMIANKRERTYISLHPEYCPENDPHVYESALGRVILQALQILDAKLASEHDRISTLMASRCAPQNRNQILSLDYAKGQLSTLSKVRSTISATIRVALSFNSIFRSSRAPRLHAQMHGHVELLSLDYAFEWLLAKYPDIYKSIAKMISEDQDEPLPLDWNSLVEDWDHTYWIVWVFLIWMIWARDGEAFTLHHHQLSSWLLEMNRAYDDEVNISRNEVLYADASEISTIDLMVKGIVNLEHFSAADMQYWLSSGDSEAGVTVATKMRNFASYVAQEEAFLANLPLQKNGSILNTDGFSCISQQKFLCIRVGKGSDVQESQGIWSRCMKRSPGLR